ncbi:hypothetical protein COLO4_38425 [Corchorus olitorius]|uniref:Uncharacterized protein n=1 Tax=Corchorus olitorius TaxID=93759 RepID=A0A1R3FV61_9ROSI|nr:hypothetical protein COLO4_38425 [Corchorus olitorius]
MQQAPQLPAPNVSIQPPVSSSQDFPAASTDVAPSLPTAPHSASSDTAADYGNSSMVGSAENIVIPSSTTGIAKGHVIVHNESMCMFISRVRVERERA